MKISSLSGLGSSFLGIHNNKKATEIKKILGFSFFFLFFGKSLSFYLAGIFGHTASVLCHVGLKCQVK